MAYLYWTVVIIGVFIIPIVAGTMYAKKLEKRRKNGFRGYRPDPFEYAMGAIVAGILLFTWPLTLPGGIVAGIFYLLFKAPQYVIDRKKSK